MNLDQKKEHVIRCVRLGMDLVSAALVAECTADELDEIESDETFIRLIDIYAAIEERDLIVKFNRAMEDELHSGKTHAVRWKLERVNPRRWGQRDSGGSPREVGRVTVNLKGRYLEGT